MPLLAETFVTIVERFAELGSTSDWAKARAAIDDCPLPMLVITDCQTAGRGRGANRWWSDGGSLTFSLAVGPELLPAERAHAPLIALASGVAVVNALAPFVAPQRLGLHWPNDVFVEQRKLGGILIEMLPNRRGVIGIGLNINNRLEDVPPEIRAATVSLGELTGKAHDTTAILVQLLKELERQLAELRSNPALVAGHADQFCLQHGQVLTLDTGQRLVSGRCLGIATDGCLKLETPEGPQSFASGVLRERS